MNIVFVGAGNVATHLSAALKKQGHTILQVFSRTEKSAKLLSEKLHCGYACSYSEVRKDGEIYIVSLSDKALEEAACEIGQINPSALWVHTSGSMPLDVFGCECRGVLYPLQTFSKQRSLALSDVPFFVEAKNEKDLLLLMRLAESVSSNVNVMDSAKRRYLHLSAVFCNNFVNHCCCLADRILSEHEIPFSHMQPLLKETISKLTELSPANAQTGPAVRFDGNIIGKHLAMLENDKGMHEIYRIMSESIHSHHSDEDNGVSYIK